MSDEADASLILEILDAAERVRTYLAPVGQAGFLRQDMVYDAVCLNLLRVGESARFLSEGFKGRLSEVPWPDLVNLRHRVAHGYETLRPEVLWLIASVNLPDLADRLRGLDEPA